jgi:hypothetical protein
LECSDKEILEMKSVIAESSHVHLNEVRKLKLDFEAFEKSTIKEKEDNNVSYILEIKTLEARLEDITLKFNEAEASVSKNCLSILYLTIESN